MRRHDGPVLALVTNDDGIDARGIRVLTHVAVAAGFDVLVAAPHEERSGSGAALSALEEGGRLIHEPRDWPDIAGSGMSRIGTSASGMSASGTPRTGSLRVMSVEASPAMIAMLACRGALGRVPDLVLSGVNHGQNTGHMVLHSGTVNAALTAAYHGVPALAVSQAAERPQHWDTAAEAAARVLAWMLDSRGPQFGAAQAPQFGAAQAPQFGAAQGPQSGPLHEPQPGAAQGRATAARALSVNVPDIPVRELRGVRQTRLARFGTVRADVIELGERHSTITFRREPMEPEPGTEEEALRGGWASVTALRGPSELPMEFGSLAF